MSCKVFRKQRRLKLHQNDFQAPSVRVEVRGTAACRITIRGQESGTPAVPNELCDAHRRCLEERVELREQS